MKEHFLLVLENGTVQVQGSSFNVLGEFAFSFFFKYTKMNKDHLQLKTVQKELNQRLKEAKEHHRGLMEKNFQTMNSKRLWDSMKIATNMKLTDNRSCPHENNDFRPIALTSVVMKCMEKLIVSQLKLEVCPQLDPYQFAYKRHRGTDDAINSLVHLVIKHLENPRAYAKLLFVDFSSAFNTLQPHILLKTMQQMNVNPFIIKWFYSFLTNRSQQVRVNRTLSESTIINTGAPQGCVSSPVLFTLYTNECTCSTVNNYMIKFSDDTAILGLISGTSDVTTYKHEVQNFVQWCDKHFLSINTKKTVEMMFDPKSIGDHLPVVINGQNIVQVDSCRYLGIHIDNKLTWSVQVENVCIRIQQRLYFLRRLRVFGVNQKVLLLFYHAVIESIFRYGISAWFGNLSVHLKAQITRLTQRAMKIMGVKQHPTPQALFEETVTRQAQKIISDPTHVLHSEYQLLPSGRRFRVPKCRLNRFKNSFVPLSIKALNDKLARGKQI